MIPEGFITNLLDRADIVDVVGRYVPLKKAGRNMTACCPFHKEKTPSFSVSPTKQFYKCFGCGEAGNAIGFIMKYEGLDFPEAVRKLAGFYGMEVPEDKSPAKARAREKARTLTDFMGEAAAFYTEKLRTTPRAADYLKGRQLSAATAAKFSLGYSPDEWHALQGLFGDKYNDRALEDCGLVNVKNDRRYDAFRGRIMFPIRNTKGQVIGFGARTMKGDEQPKYLNSPETPIYHKGSELYGLFEGREAIHAKGRAIVCEGYMDVISLSQAGFEESVAALGTSITPEHVRKLFKITDSVYFSFDGDGAGRKAARRALEATLPVITDMQKAGFVILPPEHDPDSLIKAEGAEGYEREIEKAYTLTDFMKRVLLEGKELMYAEERAKVVAEARPLVLSMTNAPILRLSIIKELAGIARLQVEEIERQYGLAQSAPAPLQPSFERRFPGRSYESGGWRGAGRRSFERSASWGGRWGRPAPEPRVRVKDMRERILQCFLSYPSLVAQFSHGIEEEFLSSSNPAAERIVEVWRAAAAEDEAGASLNPAALLSRLSESENLDYYETLLSEELVMSTPEEGARLEVQKAFLELELERTKARLEMLGHEGCRDVAALRALNDRRTELQRLVSEAKNEERDYRQRLEAQAKREQPQQSGGETSAIRKLSDNPIVARLQQHFQGAVSAVEPQPQAAGTDALREALAVRRTLSAPPDDIGGEMQSVAEHPDAPEPLPEMPAELYDAMPDDVPFAFEDEGTDPDADLNTGI